MNLEEAASLFLTRGSGGQELPLWLTRRVAACHTLVAPGKRFVMLKNPAEQQNLSLPITIVAT